MKCARLVGLLILLGWSACGEVPRDAAGPAVGQDHVAGPAGYEEARRRHEAGDLPGALAAYNEVLSADSNHIGALGNRAILLEGRGEVAAALRDYERLLRLEPNNVPALAHRAALRARTGRLSGAMEDYDALVALRPNDPLVINDRGFASYSRGDFSAALSDFERALNLAPQLTPARLNRANALYSLGRTTEAYTDYLAVLDREPGNTGALAAMGSYWMYAGGQPDSAEIYFRRALEPSPGSGGEGMDTPGKAEAWLGLGGLSFEAGDLEKAVSQYSKGILEVPDHLQLRMNRALAHYRLRQYEPAIADYEHVLQLQPGYARALAMRGYAKCEAGMVSSGCMDLRAALKRGEEGVKEALVRYCR